MLNVIVVFKRHRDLLQLPIGCKVFVGVLNTSICNGHWDQLKPSIVCKVCVHVLNM